MQFNLHVNSSAPGLCPTSFRRAISVHTKICVIRLRSWTIRLLPGSRNSWTQESHFHILFSITFGSVWRKWMLSPSHPFAWDRMEWDAVTPTNGSNHVNSIKINWSELLVAWKFARARSALMLTYTMLYRTQCHQPNCPPTRPTCVVASRTYQNRTKCAQTTWLWSRRKSTTNEPKLKSICCLRVCGLWSAVCHTHTHRTGCIRTNEFNIYSGFSLFEFRVNRLVWFQSIARCKLHETSTRSSILYLFTFQSNAGEENRRRGSSLSAPAFLYTYHSSCLTELPGNLLRVNKMPVQRRKRNSCNFLSIFRFFSFFSLLRSLAANCN